MASILIRRLDESLKNRLKLRAASHGRSMEEEARELLKSGLAAERPAAPDLGEAIRRHFAPLGGVDLALPARERVRRPPRFDK